MYKDIRVLFIGNSHTYFNDMPHLFAEKYRECTGCHAEVTMLAYSGRTLEWHMEELFSVRFNLLYGHYDYCIIQQAAHPFPGRETTCEFAKKIIDICRTAGTQPVLFMTWAEKAYPENQQKMIDCYTELAEETGSLLAPVGLVWQKLLEDPNIDLFYRDGEHASILGDYLISLVMCRLFISKEDLPKVSGTAIDFGIKMEDDVLYVPTSPVCPPPKIEQPVIDKLISAINQFMP
jgi:hypothetical protein